MGRNDGRAHSMIVTDEELEEEDELELRQDGNEENYDIYDAPELPGTVPESVNESDHRMHKSKDRRKERNRNQGCTSHFDDRDSSRKYSQGQHKSKQGRGRGEKEKIIKTKRSHETDQADYRNQENIRKVAQDKIDSGQMGQWGDDTLYWGPENEHQQYSKQTNNDGGKTGRVKSAGPFTRENDEERQLSQQRHRADTRHVIESTSDARREYDISPGSILPGAPSMRNQDIVPQQRATLPALPSHRSNFDQPIRLLPHCPIRQVMVEPQGQAVAQRRKLPQIPTNQVNQSSEPTFFGKLFRHSTNIDNIRKQENQDNNTQSASNLTHSNPDVNYLSLPRTNPPQQLTPRQLPTAPVLGTRRTFSFNQQIMFSNDDSGRISPAHRFSYHDAIRGGRESVVPFRNATISGNQVQFQDHYSSLPRERKIPRIERYNSLQGAHTRSYASPRSASYDPRRLSFHEQGRATQRPSSSFINKRMSLRADNRSSIHDNVAALHVVGNKQGFHYPPNAKSIRLSGQYLGKYTSIDPSPPPAVANLTPSDANTEPDYDVYDAPQSIDDDSVQDQYEQNASRFNPEDETLVHSALPDSVPSGRQTSHGRDYKPNESYWQEEDGMPITQIGNTSERTSSLGRGHKPTEMQWQEEDEAARRERLRQNLQKQISEEATGTRATSLGNRLTKQGSCDYHGVGATSMEMDYEYDEPEQIGFYHMEESDNYEMGYSHPYETKTQQQEDIGLPYEQLQSRQYGYNRQQGDANRDIDRRYQQIDIENEPTSDYMPRDYGVDMRIQRATERTLAQELSEAFVEEGYVEDYQTDTRYQQSRRREVDYEENITGEYYYEDERHQIDIDSMPQRQRYSQREESYQPHQEMRYQDQGDDSTQRYYEEQEEREYRQDEQAQMHPRNTKDKVGPKARKRQEYAPNYDKGRGQKMSTVSNISTSRQMSDIVEGSSHVFSPSEEEQPYLESEDSQRIKSLSVGGEDETPSPVSPRRMRRVADEYSDADLQSSHRSKVKKDAQKPRSSRSSKPENDGKSSRKQHSAKSQQAEYEQPEFVDSQSSKTHDKKSKGARPRKSGDAKPRKYHEEKKTECEVSDQGISDTHHQPTKKSSRNTTSPRHSSENKQAQRRHQSQTDDIEGNEKDNGRGQRRQRQSIRRQGRVETNQPVTDPVHESRHSSSTRTAGQICESMVEDEGDCFGSDEFNYDRDGGSGGAGHRSSGNNMRYMDDRSNCRKK